MLSLFPTHRETVKLNLSPASPASPPLLYDGCQFDQIHRAYIEAVHAAYHHEVNHYGEDKRECIIGQGSNQVDDLVEASSMHI